MSVLIYGGGAVGLGLASCLIRPGHCVEILARPETTAALTTGGLLRTGIFGSVQVEPEAFRCCTSLAEVAGGPYDFVLICTKSFDSVAAAKDLGEHENRIGPDARLVLFQNGWGNAEAFAARFDKRRIYSARVITGFRRPRPNEVEITVHAEAIHIGSLFSEDLATIEPLVQDIRHGGIPCESTDSIEKDLWAKMLYNCALNPLGAIMGVPYGKLADPASWRIIENIVREAFAVVEAEGLRLQWPTADEYLSYLKDVQLPATAQHHSSMLQDLSRGRKTEISFINGAVVEKGKMHAIPTPYNSCIVDLIQFRESLTNSGELT
jgi:2-dehydropantoate 2-reductase